MPPATPHDLAVDIHDLLQAGKKQMPDVGKLYTDAISKLNAVDLGATLDRDDSLGTGASGIKAQWNATRTAVAGMLQTEKTTIDKIGQALVDIAIKEFQDTDQAARDEYVRLYGKMEQ